MGRSATPGGWEGAWQGAAPAATSAPPARLQGPDPELWVGKKATMVPMGEVGRAGLWWRGGGERE